MFGTTDVEKSTHSTVRKTERMFTLRKVPHSYNSGPIAHFYLQSHCTGVVSAKIDKLVFAIFENNRKLYARSKCTKRDEHICSTDDMVLHQVLAEELFTLQWHRI